MAALLLLALATAVAMAAGEVAVRGVGHVDEHGTFHFRGYRVPPERWSAAAFELAPDRRAGAGPRMIDYDPDLGWSNVPATTSADGLYHHEAMGARSDGRDFEPDPPEGRIRIVLLGDSYTNGAEVQWEDTWARRLEERLASAGLDAEAVNLAVSGYGIDQAWLRWRKDGRGLGARVVIFGFQPENVRRNVNIFRPFYTRGPDLLFTKPRFTLEGDSLVPHNLPALPPPEVPRFVDGFASHPLAPLEAFRDPADEVPYWWTRSRLVATTRTVWRRRLRGLRERDDSLFFGLDTEAARLSLAILTELQRDVEESGARFLVVHLPRARHDVGGLLEGEPLAYPELLARLAERHPLVDPLEALVAAGREEGAHALHMEHGHYTPLANHIVGDAVADLLVAWLKDGAPAGATGPAVRPSGRDPTVARPGREGSP